MTTIPLTTTFSSPGPTRRRWRSSAGPSAILLTSPPIAIRTCSWRDARSLRRGSPLPGRSHARRAPRRWRPWSELRCRAGGRTPHSRWARGPRTDPGWCFSGRRGTSPTWCVNPGRTRSGPMLSARADGLGWTTTTLSVSRAERTWPWVWTSRCWRRAGRRTS